MCTYSALLRFHFALHLLEFIRMRSLFKFCVNAAAGRNFRFCDFQFPRMRCSAFSGTSILPHEPLKNDRGVEGFKHSTMRNFLLSGKGIIEQQCAPKSPDCWFLLAKNKLLPARPCFEFALAAIAEVPRFECIVLWRLTN